MLSTQAKTWTIERFPRKVGAYARMGVPRLRRTMGALPKGTLKLSTRPAPRPAAGEVQIAVDAVSLNFRDYAVALGLYAPEQPLPLIPCSDAVGRVTAIGDGVTRWKAGDRVLANYMQGWKAGPGTADEQASTLGSPLPGLLSEVVVLPEDGIVSPPEHLDAFQATALPVAGVTAFAAITDLAGARPGETLLVQGSGGVSLLGVQIGRAIGLNVIATTGSASKAKRIEALGASRVLTVPHGSDWSDAVLDATDGRGADVILDVGGEATLPSAVKAAAHGGRIVCIGFLGGVGPKLKLEELILKNVTVRGITVGSKAHLEALCALVSEHGIVPPIDEVFPMTKAEEAFAHLATGRHFGKVCIDVSGETAR